MSWSTESTDAAKLTALNTLIGNIEDELEKAVKSKSYSIPGRGKTNHDIEQIEKYLNGLYRHRTRLENKISVAAGNGNKRIIKTQMD